MSTKITLGPERIISMAPPDVHEWGPWQFPTLYKAGDTLYLSFHNAPDTYASYGSVPCRYRCDDNGRTWRQTGEGGGYPLSDGTLIRPAGVEALPAEEITMPAPVADCKYCYVKSALLYDMDEVKEEYKKWFRWTVRDGRETLEQIRVTAPGYLMRMSNGLLIRPFFYNPYFYRRDDGALMAVSYHPLHEDGHTTTYFNALYFISHDEGRSFSLMNSIPYAPPYEAVADSEHCQGWLEPSLCFTGADTAFTLLRTTCVKGVSPLYISWTHDGCRTWSQPEYFDSLGVSPQALRLPCGTVLAGYGRPGLYVRALSEGVWTERTAVVPPGELQKDTCSYCALAPIGYNKAIIVYSRFDVTDREGRTRKAMLCRDITVHEGESES